MGGGGGVRQTNVRRPGGVCVCMRDPRERGGEPIARKSFNSKLHEFFILGSPRCISGGGGGVGLPGSSLSFGYKIILKNFEK